MGLLSEFSLHLEHGRLIFGGGRLAFQGANIVNFIVLYLISHLFIYQRTQPAISTSEVVALPECT